MLTSWSRNVGFAPTYSEKRGTLPKYVFRLSSRKVRPSAQYNGF
jgi:hypothetical protein